MLAIFSQYGEILHVNLPRDKTTSKPRGFAFLLYEDQRSTVLAVDNLNGAKVLERVLRVDHVKDYKQGKVKNAETGEWEDKDEEEFNAKPELIGGGEESEDEEEDDGLPPIDPEDPMYSYLVQQRNELRLAKKTGKTKKRPNETPAEKAARKAKKKAKKERKEKKETRRGDGVKGVEALLRGFDGGDEKRRR